MIILRRIVFDDSGQGLLEYSLILSLVSIVVIGAVMILGESAFILYEKIKDNVINAM